MNRLGGVIGDRLCLPGVEPVNRGTRANRRYHAATVFRPRWPAVALVRSVEGRFCWHVTVPGGRLWIVRPSPGAGRRAGRSALYAEPFRGGGAESKAQVLTGFR